MSGLMRLTLGVALTTAFFGCQGRDGKSLQVNIRYRIFEAPRDVVHSVVSNAKRVSVQNSAYSVVLISTADLKSLMDKMPLEPGLLVDRSRTISWWPKVADTWTYSRAGTLSGVGSGAGFLGVREASDGRELRIEYDVTHSIETVIPIQSKISYEGSAPEEGALLFVAPFHLKDGSQQDHLIVFEIADWR